MSKSTTQVVRPRVARPVAKEAAEVVFPTPPLPEVMHMMRPLVGFLVLSTSEGWESTNGWVGVDAKCLCGCRCCCCCCCIFGGCSNDLKFCCILDELLLDVVAPAIDVVNPPNDPVWRCVVMCRARGPGGASWLKRQAWLDNETIDREIGEREEWRRMLCERQERGGVIVSLVNW